MIFPALLAPVFYLVLRCSNNEILQYFCIILVNKRALYPAILYYISLNYFSNIHSAVF